MRFARHATWPVLLAVVAASVGCFDDVVPAAAPITCGGDGDCPGGLVCSVFLERCVAASGGDRTAPEVVSSSFSARRLGTGGVLRVSVEADEAVRAGSVLQVGDQTVPLVGDDDAIDPDRTVVASVAVLPLGTGVFAVSVVLVDETGNLGASVLGTLEVDANPPAVEADSVTVTITQPVGTTPVADPPLAPGGRLDVTFRLDDLGADVDSLALVATGGDGPPVALDLVEHTSNEWTFGLAFDVAVADGIRALTLQASDDVGNVSSIVLAEVEVVGAVVARCVAVTGAGVPVCTDADGDGFFGPGAGCAAGQATDCDDTRALVSPDAVEILGDDVDDDCDGDAADFDAAEAAGLAIFVAPGAPADAAGTRAAPLGDLHVAAARAATVEGAALYVRGGTFSLGARPLVLHGSLVGSLDDTWRRGRERTVVTSSSIFAIDAEGALPDATITVQGIDVRGGWCEGINGPYGVLVVGDASFEIDDVNQGCSSWDAVRSNGQTLLVAQIVARLDVPAAVDVQGIKAGNDVRVLDSAFEISSVDGDVVGIGSPDSGLIARTRVTVRGFEAFGIAGEIEVVSSVIDVTGLVDPQSFFGAAAVSTASASMAHNTIEVRGGVGARIVGISTGAGVVAGNQVTVTGTDAVGLRIEDYGLGGPALHGNAFDVVAPGCLLRAGRDDPTCLPLTPCPLCTASVGNAASPAIATPTSAIDLGAPSTSVVAIDGSCRGALAGPGAGDR